MALSANAIVAHFSDQSIREFPVAAAVHIYRGAAIGKLPTGYVKPFVPGDEFVGIAIEEVDNSAGAAGAKKCEAQVVGDFELTITSVAQKDSGAPVFCTADDAFALTGHPDAYFGRILHLGDSANKAVVRMREVGEKPPNGVGSIELVLTGHEAFSPTGATAGTSYVSGFDLKSILGLGFTRVAAEDGGFSGAFDATAEVALASARTAVAAFPVDKGVTFEVDLVVTDIGDANAIDIDFGLGSALTANSEADVDHADMAQLACFHIDGASDNVLFQSDDATTDVSAVDTTIDNDSTTDTYKRYKIVVRPTGSTEAYVNGARVLSSTAFAVLSSSLLSGFINAEKTSNDTTCVVLFKNFRVAGGCAA